MKTDAQLKDDVTTELEWEPSINASSVGVAVKSGVVTLTGHLETYAEKYAVERTVANTWRKLGDTVFNVNDMLSFLEEQYPRAIAKNTAHYNNAAALLGTMNVYTNKNLTYVSN